MNISQKLVLLFLTAVIASAQAPNAPTGLSVVADPAGNFDATAELPRAFLNSSLASTPTPGKQTPVAAGASLQLAMNNANCGDVLLLQAGATFTGKFTFPAKSCDDRHWIQIRTSAPDASLPPEGTRITPCYAGVQTLVGRPQYPCPAGQQDVMATIVYASGGSGPLAWSAGANHYRIGPGIEVTRAAGTGELGSLVTAACSSKIVYDRNWIHGSPQDALDQAIGLDCQQNISIVENYFSDVHCISVIGSCTDAHVIGGGTSNTQDGPYKIHDNFIEGSGQGILFGGGAATFTPADIEVTQNHFFKPMTWLAGQPNFVGGKDPLGKCPSTPGQCPFIVKNQLECKNCQRMLVEGNIIENVWGGFTQEGFSILLTPKSQAAPNGTSICPLCMVQDVTIRYDKISHSGTGISLADVPSDAGGCAAAGQRWSIHDITNDDISVSKYAGSGGAFQIVSGCANQGEILNNLAINHVTVFPDPSTHDISMGGSKLVNQTMYGFWFTNSIIGSAKYPVWSTGGGTANCAYNDVPLSTFNTCFPAGYTFTTNALIFPQGPNTIVGYWPTGNLFPANVAAVQFANYNGGIGGDYTLLPTSPYIASGTDGKPLGADIATLNAKTAGAY